MMRAALLRFPYGAPVRDSSVRICEISAVHRVICVPSDWIGQIDPGSRAALDLAIRAVRDAGATVLTDLEFGPVAAVCAPLLLSRFCHDKDRGCHE